MNVRNIKLELTVELMNDLSSRNYLGKVKALMQNFREQVGAFRGEEELNSTTLDNEHSLKTLALEYELIGNQVIYLDKLETQAVIDYFKELKGV